MMLEHPEAQEKVTMVSMTQAPSAPRAVQAPQWKGSSWLMGAATDLEEDPLATLMAARREHGDVVRLRLGPLEAMLFSHPKDIAHVLLEHPKNYSKRTRAYDTLRLLLRNGLVTNDGDPWLKQRRTIQPGFSKDTVLSFGPVMTQAAHAMAQTWAADAATLGVRDVLEDMSHVTLRIAGLTLFGQDLQGQAAHVSEALTHAQRYLDHRLSNLLTPPLWVPTPSNRAFQRAAATLMALVTSIMDERQRRPQDARDLLGMLMGARDPVTGQPMSQDQVLDEALTLLMAGHETTAMALTWTLWRLSAHPEVARRVTAELHTVLAGRLPTTADLPHLPYLDAVIKESMRLHPPVWMLDRNAQQDDVLGDFLVKKGTMVLVSPYVTQRHPMLWRNPEGFDPERWLGDEVKALPKLAYFPFSAGQRKCIGDFFALMEAPLILATLLQSVTPELVPGHNVEPEPLVTLRPRHGMRMVMRRTGAPGAVSQTSPTGPSQPSGAAPQCPVHA